MLGSLCLFTDTHLTIFTWNNLSMKVLSNVHRIFRCYNNSVLTVIHVAIPRSLSLVGRSSFAFILFRTIQGGFYTVSVKRRKSLAFPLILIQAAITDNYTNRGTIQTRRSYRGLKWFEMIITIVHVYVLVQSEFLFEVQL